MLRILASLRNKIKLIYPRISAKNNLQDFDGMGIIIPIQKVHGVQTTRYLKKMD